MTFQQPARTPAGTGLMPAILPPAVPVPAPALQRTSKKFLEVIQVFVKGLLKRCQGKKTGDKTDRPDNERAPFQAEGLAEELEQQGDGHHHAPDEIRNGRGDRCAEVRAELL